MRSLHLMSRYLRSLLIAALAVLSFAPARAQSSSAPYDLVIRNGHIIDGTGSPWYSADIGIRDGRIAAIGHLDAAHGHAHASTRAAWSSRRVSSTCWASRR